MTAANGGYYLVCEPDNVAPALTTPSYYSNQIKTILQSCALNVGSTWLSIAKVSNVINIDLATKT